MIKILFCALKYEYANPAGPLSAIEHDTFYATIKKMPGVEVEFFGMDEVMSKVGRDEMNKLLIAEVESKKPDMLFCILFTDQIKKETIEYITKHTKTKTFNWFADDSWRFHIFSRYWAPLFTMSATTDPGAIPKYRALGIKNVTRTQWAANLDVYCPSTPEKNKGDLNITFVGGKYGKRGPYLEFLKSKNLPAEAYGTGWPNGRVSPQRMVEIFSYSKINLNFTETPFMTFKERLRAFSRVFIKDGPSGRHIDFSNPFGYFRSAIDSQKKQFKARIFEVPACGGFMLTGEVAGLEDYYDIGKELVTFKNKNDLAEKCRYYLDHESERMAIAEAGYRRTLAEHTYERRFMKIFDQMGFKL